MSCSQFIKINLITMEDELEEIKLNRRFKGKLFLLVNLPFSQLNPMGALIIAYPLHILSQTATYLVWNKTLS